MYNRLREKTRARTEPGEVNLRKYTILGGVYHLDLFYQPAQPKDMVTFDMMITACKL